MPNFPKIHQTLLPLHTYVATIQYDVDFVHTFGGKWCSQINIPYWTTES